ncbi:MAG: helix-turn-helix domain-containing protein [Nitriliruptor sp.]
MIERTLDDVEDRAAIHRALGDPTRLRIVDALQLSDRSPTQLGQLLELPTNLLAFHLGVLEEAGLVVRTPSQGDARRRYVALGRHSSSSLDEPRPLAGPLERVLFVCTANSARSQLAAALWHARTGQPALSAGTEPATHVHPLAIEVARERGIDLDDATPTGYDAIATTPDLVVSVCDRAHESQVDAAVPRLHWSIPDPVGGPRRAFARTYDDLAVRVDRLARAACAA